MFRILLELNDLPLLRKIKPHLVDEVLHQLGEMAGEGASVRGEETILLAESEDEEHLENLAGRLYTLYRFLREQRLKLHGFVLGLDYRGARERFTFLPDILWGGAWKSDTLVLSEAAYPLLAPFFSLIRSPAGWTVDTFLEQAEEERRPFYLSSHKDNLAQIDELLLERAPSGRPFFFHSLIPEEQFRLAAACAEDPFDSDAFLLVDLNYPWRSTPAAWINAYAPETVEKLSPYVSEERRSAWEKRGTALFRGELLFNDADFLAWYGEALRAFIRRTDERGVEATLVVLGAERLDRCGRILVSRTLAPLHERGSLRLVLFGAGLPRGGVRRIDAVEFRRAESPGEPLSLRKEREGEAEAILELAARFAPFMPAGELNKRLYEAGFSKHRVDEFFAVGSKEGEIFRTWRYYFVGPRLSHRIESTPTGSSLEPFLRSEGGIPGLYLVEYAALAAAMRPRAGEELFVRLLRSLYERGFGRVGREALAVFESVGTLFPGLSALARGLEAAFAERDQQLVGLTGITGLTGSKQQAVSSLGMTLETEALLRRGEAESALSLAKNFLYRIQDGEEGCQVAQGHNGIGAAMLRQGKVEEAADYFSLAYEAAKGCPSLMDKIKAQTNQAAAQFLFGNYAMAIRLLRETVNLSPGLSYGPYLLYARFLLARCVFVLGRYAEAEEELWHALSLATLIGAPHDLFYAWIGRSMIYDGRIKQGLTLLGTLEESAEILHYRAEGLFFENRTRRALEASRGAAKKLKRQRGRFRGGFGRFAWDHGYQNLEDLAFLDPAGRGVLDNQITVFRLYLERLESGERGGRETLERITRSGRLSEFDPHLHYYYLLHGLIIPDATHDETLERITYLSKGLKHLQRIAALIDDVQCRLDFTQKSRWNSRLMELAREEKLV